MTLSPEELARRDVRQQPSRIDYARMNRIYPKQKAALTRAVNAWKKAKAASPQFDPHPSVQEAAERILAACRKAVREWDEVGAWPDGWHSWQIALDDTRHWTDSIDLRDLDTTA